MRSLSRLRGNPWQARHASLAGPTCVWRSVYADLGCFRLTSNRVTFAVRVVQPDTFRLLHRIADIVRGDNVAAIKNAPRLMSVDFHGCSVVHH